MTVIFISEFMQINAARNAVSAAFVRSNAGTTAAAVHRGRPRRKVGGRCAGKRETEGIGTERNFRAGDFNRDSTFLFHTSMCYRHRRRRRRRRVDWCERENDWDRR